MASSFNSITIVGNLGRDPEQRALPDGTPVTNFSVATTERRRDGDRTTWFKVTAFGKLAETCSQYLHKGSYVYVEGSLSQNDYTDREGNAKTSLEVRANQMKMLDKVGDSNAGQSQPAATPRRATRPAPAQQESSDSLADLPF
jgi:single-strand DNA-binding protein